mmetsp:Transcript_35718/g.114384  ORF Transcript_35718/g.114384 Transcript_35718/m.114384 type:complete len:155 (-) Transcript_35718:3767-4231(-)
MPVDAQFSKMTTAHTVSNSFDFTTFARIPGCLMVISSAICDSTELQRRFLHSPGSTTSSVGPTHVFCVSPLPRLAELPALSCEEVQLRGLRKDLGISRGLLGNSVFCSEHAGGTSPLVADSDPLDVIFEADALWVVNRPLKLDTTASMRLLSSE